MASGAHVVGSRPLANPAGRDDRRDDLVVRESLGVERDVVARRVFGFEPEVASEVQPALVLDALDLLARLGRRDAAARGEVGDAPFERRRQARAEAVLGRQDEVGAPSQEDGVSLAGQQQERLAETVEVVVLDEARLEDRADELLGPAEVALVVTPFQGDGSPRPS